MWEDEDEDGLLGGSLTHPFRDLWAEQDQPGKSWDGGHVSGKAKRTDDEDAEWGRPAGQVGDSRVRLGLPGSWNQPRPCRRGRNWSDGLQQWREESPGWHERHTRPQQGDARIEDPTPQRLLERVGTKPEDANNEMM